MRCTLSFALVAALVLASPATSRHWKAPAPSVTPKLVQAAFSTSNGYHLQQALSGQSLLNSFNFVAGQADNGGVAYYNGLSDAWNKGLLAIDGNDQVSLRVGTGGYEQSRDALKLVSSQAFNGGLFIFDVAAMPAVCGAWPAIWFTGSNWPADGEIDVVEGVGLTTMNAMSTHTSAGCNQQSGGFSGSFMMNDNSKRANCDALATGDQGCGVRSLSKTSFGVPFNSQGGGVFALKWDGSGISTYHFARNSIPSDLSAGNPNPSAWGTAENFVSSTGCASSHFKNLLLVINTNLCGVWPDGTWTQDMSYAGQTGSCAQKTGFRTCAEYVRSQGAAFSNASWKINSIKVYQQN